MTNDKLKTRILHAIETERSAIEQRTMGCGMSESKMPRMDVAMTIDPASGKLTFAKDSSGNFYLDDKNTYSDWASMLDVLAQLNIKPGKMPADWADYGTSFICGDFSVKLMWSNHRRYPTLYQLDKLLMSFEPEMDLSIALRKAELIAVAAATSGAKDVLARTINSIPVEARLPEWQAFAQANPVSAATQSAS